MNELIQMSWLFPEIIILVMACIILLVGAAPKSESPFSYYGAQISLIVAGILSYVCAPHQTLYEFNGNFILDPFAVWMKLFVYMAVFLSFMYSRRYVDQQRIPRTEFYVLGLLSTLGMMVLISSANLITLYLGLELLSLPLYAMVAMERTNPRSIEAAIKYFVLGSFASALLLYGFSLFFGFTQTLDMHQISVSLSSLHDQPMVLILALVLILAGLAFKWGAAPFQLWVPDVYEGAPSAVTLFISAAPKLAAFALAVRLLLDTMPSLLNHWQPILIVISLLSMAVGNVVAIVQKNIKRMLGYSSIAHMGYMCLGLAAGTINGFSASMFYIISYTLMSLGAFGVIVLMSKEGYELESIEDFSGLNTRNPWLAFTLLLIMFSMAGIPPLFGFIAKVGLLESLIQVHMTWLAVTAILFAIIGAYYYLRIVKVMYFEEPLSKTPFVYTRSEQIAISINAIAVLLLGVFPGALFVLCHLVI